MLLSIIIVNYRSTKYILDCLQSAGPVLMQNKEIEWIIVDNDSNDDGENQIRSLFPQVQFLQMGYNAGFARANNAGIKIAKGAHVLLLNPDTLLPENSILNCVQRFAASDCVACGVQLVHADKTPQFSGSYFTKGGLNHVLELPYWGKAVKWVANVLNVSKPSFIQVEKEIKVDWVSGAFLMVKQSAIEKAGLMDEDFFLYAEEVEWCSRLGKIGPLCLFGDITMVHLIGTTYSNLSDKTGLQLMISNHVRIRKQYGIFWFILLLLNYTWAVPYAFIASVIIHAIKGKSPFTELDYLSGFAKNVGTIWTMLPTIILGKKYFYKFL
jgi:GT2 family glycosyltransferase